MNIRHLLKRRKWTQIILEPNGGLIIKFEDKSHTYISPERMEEIVYEYEELDINKDE